MGRHKLYRTKEFLNERNKKQRMECYWRNADIEREKARERYHKKKQDIQNN